MEMHARLTGTWQETEDDILLQHRFWNHMGITRDWRHLSLYPRIGAQFLRQNQAWLLG